MRFPILLALNKADIGTAAAHINHIAVSSGDVSVPVSAQAEWTLCRLRRLGLVSYAYGASSFSLIQSKSYQQANSASAITSSPAASDPSLRDNMPVESGQPAISVLLDSARRVLSLYNSTGVLNALNRAVSLNPPICVYPVEDLETLEALPRPSIKGGPLDSHEVLRDCFLMYPGEQD